MTSAILIVFLFLISGCFPVDQPQILDLAGKHVNPLHSEAQATTLFFIQTDCPISNRYAPQIARLHNRFQDQDIDFWLVYPERSEDPAAIRQHLAEYGLPPLVARDIDHTLVDRFGATITPEVVVLGSRGNVAYRGRIDDRYTAIDQMRPQATRNDLAEALEALLAGKHPDPSTTQAIGCLIADLK